MGSRPVQLSSVGVAFRPELMASLPGTAVFRTGQALHFRPAFLTKFDLTLPSGFICSGQPVQNTVQGILGIGVHGIHCNALRYVVNARLFIWLHNWCPIGENRPAPRKPLELLEQALFPPSKRRWLVVIGISIQIGKSSCAVAFCIADLPNFQAGVFKIGPS